MITPHTVPSSQKSSAKSSLLLWLETLVFGSLIFVIIEVYGYVRESTVDISSIAAVFANTAFILIGLSMALSGICYFWNFADTKIIYRKYLGVIGFFFVSMHVLITLFEFPQFAYYLGTDTIMSFTFGALAFLMFLLMASISNMYAIKLLGGKTWRQVLRLGYLAYIYAIIHMTMKMYPEWQIWIRSENHLTLPPISLLVMIFASSVISLRIAVEISSRLTPKKAVT